MSLNDEILRATGGPTVNDGLRSWFGAVGSESLDDAELKWLKGRPGVTSATTISDGWHQFQPGPGTINDKKLNYWSSQP